MTIFQRDRNVWQTGHAFRATALVDAAAYFGALRKALLLARENILIVGWDIDSRAPLVGESGVPDDPYPAPLGEFICALAAERPGLTVSLLLWDYSVIYSAERELLPGWNLGLDTSPCVRLCLDDVFPLGSAHHQKIVSIDDSIAFSGGIDLTQRRWDTPAHDLHNPLRVDLSGAPYRPFHDVHIVVDGDAARHIADLARIRWRRATGERLQPTSAPGNRWPDDLAPHLADAEIAIALTQPAYDSIPERRDVENLFLDTIALAERHIYIENQFLTHIATAKRIASRMKERPDLETLIIAPHTHESWIEARTMRNGRIEFARVFEREGVAERVRMLFPDVAQDGDRADTMVHSKVMIIDDRFLRIGSANLNNRSMGTDTECDLAIEAAGDEHRAAIARIRNGLLGEHCGVDSLTVERAIAETGSLLRAAETLEARGHRLLPIEDGNPDPKGIASGIGAIADPNRTLGVEEFLQSMVGREVPYRSLSQGVQIALAGLALIALALVWRYTPLAALTDVETLRGTAQHLSESPWAPALVIGVFVIGAFVLFPVTILIAVTAGTFGPWLGLVYAAAGALTSALVTYAIGARIGKNTLRNLLGPRLNRVTRRIAAQGVIAVATLRLMPVAPFTIVNLVAGASGIRLVDFMLGSALGMLPGLIVLSSLGHQIFRVMASPTWTDIGIFAAIIIGWIALSFGLQALVSKLRRATA